MLLKISGYSTSKRPWAALENELYFRGIMLAVREWVHVSAGNGLWEMSQWNSEKGEARRKKRSGGDLSATTHHLLKSRSGPRVVPWYFCLAFRKKQPESLCWCAVLAERKVWLSDWLFTSTTFCQVIRLNKTKITYKTKEKTKQENPAMDACLKKLVYDGNNTVK